MLMSCSDKMHHETIRIDNQQAREMLNNQFKDRINDIGKKKLSESTVLNRMSEAAIKEKERR